MEIASPYLVAEQSGEDYHKIKKTLYDLGCGDGRICIAASKRFQCHSVGCEVEEYLIKKFSVNIELEAEQMPILRQLVSAVHGDLQELDISSATVIVLYLLPESIALINDMLVNAIQNGCVLICNTWGPKTLIPKQRFTCGFSNNVTLLLYDRSSLPNKD
eukprot:gene25549-34107_t